MQLARRTREMRVLVSASDAVDSPLAAMIPLSNVAIEVVHSASSQVVGRAIALAASPSAPSCHGQVETAENDKMLAMHSNYIQNVPAAVALLPFGLIVNESYAVNIVPHVDTTFKYAQYRAATSDVVVLAGEGTMETHIYTERVSVHMRERT